VASWLFTQFVQVDILLSIFNLQVPLKQGFSKDLMIIWIIMLSYRFESPSENSVDLLFNSYSLAEMGKKTIENYIRLNSKVRQDYFYHLNHVHWEIGFDSFPIDFDKIQMLFRKPINWGKDPHR